MFVAAVVGTVFGGGDVIVFVVVVVITGSCSSGKASTAAVTAVGEGVQAGTQKGEGMLHAIVHDAPDEYLGFDLVLLCSIHVRCLLQYGIMFSLSIVILMH